MISSGNTLSLKCYNLRNLLQLTNTSSNLIGGSVYVACCVHKRVARQTFMVIETGKQFKICNFRLSHFSWLTCKLYRYFNSF